MTTLPLPPFITLVLGILLATALLYGALSLMRRNPEAPMWEGFGTGWVAIIVILGLVWLGLFGLTVAAVFSGAWQAILDPRTATIGLGGLTAALLGAPFLIWGTILKHQTVRWQKEGHMTDRISKAVEQLGAEKKVDRIGRHVVIRYTPPGDPLFDDRDIGPPEDRTEIEWRDESIHLAPNELVIDEGNWQAFAETVPNLEVRIGAILSLERIAQDSTTHDKGRDHVRVMEILCAYIRENAPARTAKDHPFGDWEPLKDDATEDERWWHLRRREQRLRDFFFDSPLYQWAQSLKPPREDIALALKVIGRRTPAQIRVEAAWPDPPDARTNHPADTPCPALPDVPGDAPLPATDLEAFKTDLKAWTEALRAHAGYRLDLRETNLQRADLTDGSLSFSRFDGARMEGAILRQARLDGADLGRARMEGANLGRACITGARLGEARMEGANLRKARMEGAYLRHARMEGAYLRQARLEGANLGGARMEGAELGEARMDGAYLSLARMEGTNLSEARIEGGDLSLARIEGADLWRARIQGANLWEARMGGTNLGEARMDGTFLWRARMEGVYLGDAQMNEATDLKDAIFHEAGLRSVDWSSVKISQAQVDASFGDSSVILPDTLNRPRHWPDWALPQHAKDGGPSYDSELAKWRTDPASYTPPPPP
ncbi:pentapeptide repeat-containing protein [Pararhodobacter sp.]|uniref:pentapeptide repeat-containing protein n=1 Tax=Pararhodobacter sp. TaxID=2127056 RepID=UPI002FE3FCE0